MPRVSSRERESETKRGREGEQRAEKVRSQILTWLNPTLMLTSVAPEGQFRGKLVHDC